MKKGQFQSSQQHNNSHRFKMGACDTSTKLYSSSILLPSLCYCFRLTNVRKLIRLLSQHRVDFLLATQQNSDRPTDQVIAVWMVKHANKCHAK